MSEKIRPVELLKQIQSIMNAERWLGAIKLLKDNLSVVQKDWKLSWNLAWCYLKSDRLDQARTHMIRAAKLAPKNAICRFGLGAVYLEMKKFKKAETNCAESLRIKDAYVPRLTLALAYMNQGKITDAENVHLEGIKLKPKESRRYEAYADFLSDVGREEQAQTMYRKAKKLDRKSPANARKTVIKETGPQRIQPRSRCEHE
jgi:Flp pilus assembly protein TadD